MKIKDNYHCNRCETALIGGITAKMETESGFEHHHFCGLNCFTAFCQAIQDEIFGQTIHILEFKCVDRFGE